MSRNKAYRPGESPFHAKGTLWMGVREFIDEAVPEGIPAVLRHLDPDTREFFTQMFLASGWYDILPILRVAEAIALAMGVETSEYQRLSAIWHAERDLRGAYAPVLRFDTPAAVCHRFASIYSLLYDFGRAEVVSEEPGSVRACAYGIPETLAPWWTRASECYIVPVLRAAGARNPRLVWGAPQPDGERDGIHLVRVPSTTIWD